MTINVVGHQRRGGIPGPPGPPGPQGPPGPAGPQGSGAGNTTIANGTWHWSTSAWTQYEPAGMVRASGGGSITAWTQVWVLDISAVDANSNNVAWMLGQMQKDDQIVVALVSDPTRKATYKVTYPPNDQAPQVDGTGEHFNPSVSVVSSSGAIPAEGDPVTLTITRPGGLYLAPYGENANLQIVTTPPPQQNYWTFVQWTNLTWPQSPSHAWQVNNNNLLAVRPGFYSFTMGGYHVSDITEAQWSRANGPPFYYYLGWLTIPGQVWMTGQTQRMTPRAWNASAQWSMYLEGGLRGQVFLEFCGAPGWVPPSDFSFHHNIAVSYYGMPPEPVPVGGW